MINFDQAATTFPKPIEVIEKYVDIVKNYGVNYNRGFSENEIYIASEIFDTRQVISNFFDGYGADNVVFTSNVTVALNMIIRGYAKKGDHILISALEHNAVYRTVHSLFKEGIITYDIIPADIYGEMELGSLHNLIKENTTMLIATMGSNICPILNPIEKIGEYTNSKGIKFIVDAAQGAGIIDLSMKKCKIDALCFTGHKSLMGLQGSGGFLVTTEFANDIKPIICGGTGSKSSLIDMPKDMPDKFEAGTMNVAGIIALKEAIKFIEKVGIKNIYDHEMRLFESFIRKLKKMENYELIGYKDKYRGLPVICIYNKNIDSGILADKLAQKNITTRVGIHCAPLAHKTLGSYPKGGVRFSFGYFNTIEEVDICIDVLKHIDLE